MARRVAPEMTAELVACIRDHVLAGNCREVAAASEGVDRETLVAWLLRGASGARVTVEDALCAALVVELDKAEATSEAQAVAAVQRGAASDPRMALLYLERRWPERWAPRSTVTTVTEVPSALSDATLRERLREIARGRSAEERRAMVAVVGDGWIEEFEGDVALSDAKGTRH